MVLPMRSSLAVTPGRSAARPTAGAASAPAEAAMNRRRFNMVIILPDGRLALLMSCLRRPRTDGRLHVRALDHATEAHPGPAVPALQLHVTDRVVVGRAGADLHAR